MIAARALPSNASVAVFSALAATLCALFPLPVYLVTLAAFGLAHVVTELKYLDERFAGRWPRKTTLVVFALLALVVGLRLSMLAGRLAPATERWIELTAIAALVAVALPLLVRGGAARGALGAAITIVPLAGAWIDPLTALVAFAVLHNVTPVLFVSERRDLADRARSLRGGAIVFGAVPILVALAAAALARGSTIDPAHAGAFVPRPLIETSFAFPLFAAATYLQCMHYGAVLLVLPRLPRDADASRRSLVRWPSPRVFAALVALAALALVPLYARSFADARAAYGVLSAVHAWIEIPVLLLAFAAMRPVRA